MSAGAHDIAMSDVEVGGEIAWRGDHPACRVVQNAWTGKIGGVGVWNPKTWTYDVERLTGPVEAKVQETFVRSAAQSIADAVTQPPTGTQQLFSLAEGALDPSILASKLAGAAAEVAALHAGFPLPAAQVIGRLTENAVRSLLPPGSAETTVGAVRCLDIGFSVVNGRLISSPGLREITVDQGTDAIDKLLGADGRHVDERHVKPPLEPPARDHSDRLERLAEHQRLERERLELRLERERLERQAERKPPERRGPEISGPGI